MVCNKIYKIYRVNARAEGLQDGNEYLHNHFVLTTSLERAIVAADKQLKNWPMYQNNYKLLGVESAGIDYTLYWRDESNDLIVDDEVYNIKEK